jgi:hypothetical protein
MLALQATSFSNNLVTITHVTKAAMFLCRFIADLIALFSLLIIIESFNQTINELIA